MNPALPRRSRWSSLLPACTLIALAYLTPAWNASAAPVIVEFVASNDKSLYDEDGESSDWLELLNPDATPVDLTGWHLTNDAGELDRAHCFKHDNFSANSVRRLHLPLCLACIDGRHGQLACP